MELSYMGFNVLLHLGYIHPPAIPFRLEAP